MLPHASTRYAQTYFAVPASDTAKQQPRSIARSARPMRNRRCRPSCTARGELPADMRGLLSGCEIEEDESKATCAVRAEALSDKQWSAGFQFQAEADEATKHRPSRRMLMPACSRQAPECFRALLAILIKMVLPGLQPHNARTRSAQGQHKHEECMRESTVMRSPRLCCGLCQTHNARQACLTWSELRGRPSAAPTATTHRSQRGTKRL